MLIVIPVGETDADLIEPYTSVMAHFGPYLKHDLLVVSRPSDSKYADMVFEKLNHLFKNSTIHRFPTDGKRGWPEGPNFYWKSTIEFLNDTNNQLPWLFMECDLTPLKRQWIDIIEAEYTYCGKLCMGTLQNTTTVTTDGEIVHLTKHLVGAGVYPPNINICCDMWAYVDRIPTAFDVLVQWQIAPNTHNAITMQHGFRTRNYKFLEDGITIKGEDHNNFPGGLRYDEPIKPYAVLHHGCDDGSLAKLLVTNNLS